MWIDPDLETLYTVHADNYSFEKRKVQIDMHCLEVWMVMMMNCQMISKGLSEKIDITMQQVIKLRSTTQTKGVVVHTKDKIPSDN